MHLMFSRISHPAPLNPDADTGHQKTDDRDRAAGPIRNIIFDFGNVICNIDISITENTSDKATRNIVAIEIKGGADQSNIWNRLGEAEKSHQSAKQCGFVEFWTIYNVSDLDEKKAREKSPTTNRFYALPELARNEGSKYEDFRDRIASLVGICICYGR